MKNEMVNPGPEPPAGGFIHRHRQLVVKTAETQVEIEAALRLRYEVFNLELGEGLASSETRGLDEDRFDQVCDHILVIDEDENKVVGTYRLLPAFKVSGWEDYYAWQEFDIRPLESLGSELLELGRSCVHPQYRQAARVISLLWRGIASYVIMNGIEHMFGCTSLHSVDPVQVSRIFHYLLRRQGPLPNLPWVEPHPDFRFPLAEDSPPADEERLLASCPPILKGYLSLGAFICGSPALDAEFNCTDLFTILSADRATERWRNYLVREDTPAPIRDPKR
jgi:putative hemolysin